MLNNIDDLDDFDRTVGNAMITTASVVILSLIGLAVWAIWAVMS